MDEMIREDPAVNRWIPLTEMLPEKWKNVLVVLNQNGYRYIDIAEMYEDASWLVSGEFWYEKNDPILTHWMPLPELPEIEEMHEKG